MAVQCLVDPVWQMAKIAIFVIPETLLAFQMKTVKNLSILLNSVQSLLITSFVQYSSNLEIDPNIKEKATKYIQPSGYRKTNDRTLTYNNFMQAETYVNDELLSTITKGRMDIFICYYYWDKDVLIIEGGFYLV